MHAPHLGSDQLLPSTARGQAPHPLGPSKSPLRLFWHRVWVQMWVWRPWAVPLHLLRVSAPAWSACKVQMAVHQQQSQEGCEVF